MPAGEETLELSRVGLITMSTSCVVRGSPWKTLPTDPEIMYGMAESVSQPADPAEKERERVTCERRT